MPRSRHAFLLPLTRATVSTRTSSSFPRGIFVPLGASRPCEGNGSKRLRARSEKILAATDYSKVGRIHASTLPANMIELLVPRDWPQEEFVDVAMGVVATSRTAANLAVSPKRPRARPEPAGASPARGPRSCAPDHCVTFGDHFMLARGKTAGVSRRRANRIREVGCFRRRASSGTLSAPRSRRSGSSGR